MKSNTAPVDVNVIMDFFLALIQLDATVGFII